MTSVAKVANDLAEKGRGGDAIVGHLTPGDLVIPMELHTPEMISALRKHFSTNGTSIERYTAGNKENSINPETGQPEFFLGGLKHFISHPLKSITKYAKGVINDPWSTIGTIVGAATGNPFLAAAGNFAGQVASRGPKNAFGDELGSSLAGAATAGLGSYAGGQLLSQFPETGAAINDFIPDLGIGDTLSSIGSSVSNALPDLGIGDTFSSAANTVSGGVNNISSSLGLGDIAPVGFSPGASASSLAAPSGADGSLPWLDETGTNLSEPFSFNVGSGTVGTPGLSASDTNFLNNAANSAATTNATGSLASAASEAAASAPSSIDTFMDNPGLGTALNVLKANPAAVIGAGGLGYAAMQQGQPLPGEDAVNSTAAELSSQGKELQKYLQTGTLPPGLQGGIDQAAASAKATIRSQYAARGMSGSSAEAQDLAHVDQAAQAQGAQMAMQLLQTGISETGMASQLYQQILQSALQQDQSLGTAIANFASNAAGGGQNNGLTINYDGK